MFTSARPRHLARVACAGLACLAALAAAPATAATAAPITVSDDTGRSITLAAPAKRIVSLAPHITELLYAAGAGERIVATVDHSDYPEAAAKLPRVGGYSRIDLEAVAAAKPDLVIAWQSGNAAAHVDKLKTLGLPLFLSQPNRIEDVAASLEKFGQLAGTSAPANAAAAQFRRKLAELDQRYRQRPKVRVFYQVWKQPLLTIGGHQIISDVIRLCGGENVFGHLTTMAPAVSVEAVVAANPEVIVASGMGDERPDWLDDWKRWTRVTAVARNNLFFVPPALIQRHTPRLLLGAERLCEQLESARAKRAP